MSKDEAKKSDKPKRSHKLNRLLKLQQGLRKKRDSLRPQRVGMMIKRGIEKAGYAFPAHGKVHSGVRAATCIVRLKCSEVVDTANMTVAAGGSGITVTPKRMEMAIIVNKRKQPLTEVHDYSTLLNKKK